LPHVDVAIQGVTNINSIKVLLNMNLRKHFSLTEWCHCGIVCLVVLWTLILLLVLKVDWINFGLTAMLWKPISLGPETEVYVRCKVFFNVAYVNEDEDTDIDRGLAYVRQLSLSCLVFVW